MKKLSVIVLLIFIKFASQAQSLDFNAVKAEVNFGHVLREWDGFGINYVECAQTFDYEKYPQDYGGFDVLSEKDKQEIIQLVFGNEGLRPNIIKMFLDPLHQKTKGGVFDHETTTESMRYFAKHGYKLIKERNDTLSIITTLYGPPAYITKQRILRGRDLDPNCKKDLCLYMIDWARYLKEEEHLPVKYISLHNEGESWLRFPQDGTLGSTAEEGHDYNFFWSPEQVNEIMVMTHDLLSKSGLNSIGVTNGEPTNWYRFSYWGFADKMYSNEDVMDATAIVTSHGFYVGEQSAGRWFGPHSSKGIDLLRTKRPDLKAWCTSTSWDSKDMSKVIDGKIDRRYIMDAGFVKEIHGNIYEAKVNAIIPWAFIQKASHWNKPDPNPGSAIRVYDDGTWEIKKGYYYYKQLTTAGRAGMNVVETSAMDSEIAIIGFEKNGTSHPNSFVVINYGKNDKLISLSIKNAECYHLEAYRTTGEEIYGYYETANKYNLEGTENYESVSGFSLSNGELTYFAPQNSVTTFFLH